MLQAAWRLQPGGVLGHLSRTSMILEEEFKRGETLESEFQRVLEAALMPGREKNASILSF